MNSFLRTIFSLLLLSLFSLLSACGGGSSLTPATTPAVTPTVTKIDINPSSATLVMGRELALTINATYSDGKTAPLATGIKWTSTLNSITADGKVTATKSGSDTITATFENKDTDGKVTGTIVKTATITVPIPGFEPLAAGGNQTISRLDDGQLYGWGNNLQGQLGDNTIIDRNKPILLTGDHNWREIAIGNEFAVAIKPDGTLWAWGNNLNGQLGNGATSTTPIPYPTQIGNATDWETVAAGNSHAMAINKAGELFAWGANYAGQLGNSTNDSKLTPTKIEVKVSIAGKEVTLSWRKVACGDAHSLAISSDAGLYAWGGNANGQLGDNTNVSKLVPTLIGNKKWALVAAGANHSVAIQTDSTLWAWGLNSSSQVGDGTTLARSTPTQLGTNTNWLQVAAGAEHSVGVRTDGTLWTWGDNSDGQLGNGTIAAHLDLAPTQIGSNSNWSQVSAGSKHSVARNNGGQLWSWGRNDEGQQGNQSNTDVLTPTKVNK